MTAALKSLYREKKKMGLKDQTTYEVTHHGPILRTPSFFIEIGSNETRWEIPELGRAIAKSLLSDEFLHPETTLPIAIGIGGGHYAPRFTDRAMRNKFAFGHMIPDYILMNSEDLRSVVELAVRSTPDVRYAFFHRSGKNERFIAKAETIVEEIGLKIAN
jgi:D-aminoacyl-tRNA deacylase